MLWSGEGREGEWLRVNGDGLPRSFDSRVVGLAKPDPGCELARGSVRMVFSFPLPPLFFETTLLSCGKRTGEDGL